MRKLIISSDVSLDGVMESPEQWSLDFWNDERLQLVNDQLRAVDALLLGRDTYQGFAEFWPSQTDEQGFAARFNSLPKFVASTTLAEPLTWNATLLKGNVADEVAKLKQQSGQAILKYGGGPLLRTLVQHNLVDEYWLWVAPVVVGKGKRLFDDGLATTLKLAEAKAFSTGAVLLRYQPASKT